MVKIKTKQTTIVTRQIDRAAVIADRFRKTATHTGDLTNRMRNERGQSEDPEGYATDRYMEGVRVVQRKLILLPGKRRGRSAHGENRPEGENFEWKHQALRERIGRRQNETLHIERASRKSIKIPAMIRNSHDTAVAVQKRTVEKVIRQKQIREMVKRGRTAGQTARRTAGSTAERAGKTVRHAKRMLLLTKKLTKLLGKVLAGGCCFVVAIILICCLFGASYYVFGDTSSAAYTQVTAEVQAYEPVIRRYAIRYGMGEYVELIKAVMMQESGGRGNDPMQASESPYNTRYPHQPGGIQNPEYSIQCGVQALKQSFDAAHVKSPVDMDRIRLALQGYNYGNGYITWAIARDGGYTVENAAVFSEQQAASHGWYGYGDRQYPAHVLRYYPFGNYNIGIGNTVITRIASTQIGNEGGTPYWSWYGFGARVEWCACFVSWCADQGGYIEAGILPKFSYCPVGIEWFQKRGQWQASGYTPAAGDIVFFDWDGDGISDHVGIVESCDGTTIHTIEGNSGDRCVRREYPVESRNIMGYGVPKY